MLTLVIANKNYSSWSARPWLLLTELGIPFTEKQIKFHSKAWEEDLPKYSPTRRVPVLWESEMSDGLVTYDSLAIVERVYELHPDRGVLPEDPSARSEARALMAAFHSSFHYLRKAMPMNIRREDLDGFGHTADAISDIEELSKLILRCKSKYGQNGQFIFGSYSAVDAYMTPVMSRFKTYGVDLKDSILNELQHTLLATTSMKEWTKGALQETEFVKEDEPYDNRAHSEVNSR